MSEINIDRRGFRDHCVSVLDHGYVRLVDWMGSDLSVVRAARVSYDAAWRAGIDESSDTKLINYLWKNQHTTPFESVTFTFEIYAPIFIIRQWHRHRTWSYNELSARYKELPEVFYLPKPHLVGNQSASNKQGRTVVYNETLIAKRHNEIRVIENTCKAAFTLYKALIDSDWPRELARAVLPVNTYTQMFGTVNLLNLLKFFNLRSDPHAQWEIRQYSDAMVTLVESVVPVCMGAWRANKINNKPKE